MIVSHVVSFVSQHTVKARAGEESRTEREGEKRMTERRWIASAPCAASVADTAPPLIKVDQPAHLCAVTDPTSSATTP